MGQFQYDSFRCDDESGSCSRDFSGKWNSSRTSLPFHPLDKPHDLQYNSALCLARDRLKKGSFTTRSVLSMVGICVSLKAMFCFEFNIGETDIASIGTGFHMEAFNMSHKMLLMVQCLIACPVFQPSRVHHQNTYPPILCCSTKTEKKCLNYLKHTALFVHCIFVSLQ